MRRISPLIVTALIAAQGCTVNEVITAEGRTLDFMQYAKRELAHKSEKTDERIKAAVPVAGITDLENHVIDGTVEGHCDCMYFANTYGWDYPQVAALVAPRPLLISNTDRDSIFPLGGVVR